ncbi:MAG: VCBS repeat-containing protein, partial [Gammaproteobacteria bacterium]|nr:VCBS repeat-containing protein [Gammaproteobacteria bacterium]
MKPIQNTNNLATSAAIALSFFSLFIFPASSAFALTGDVAPRGAPDGKFDIADYVVLQQFVLGKATPTPAEIVAADVAPAGNPNGIINLADIIVLQRAIVNNRLQSGMMICMPGSGCPQGAYLAGATYLQQATDSQGNVLSVVYFDSARNPLTMQYDINGNIIGSNLVPIYQPPSDSTGNSTEVVGSLGGEFSVSPGGAATYSIPVEIPPGISGMQPQVSIVYDSSAENGLLGMGFVLSAQSEITRCHKTLAVEGVVSGVNYDATDAYCLDGQKLISIGGNQYITETGTTSKIEYVNNVFTVTSRSGTTTVYGSADSNILAQGKSVTRVWAVKSETDQYGNYVTYNYTQDGVNGDYWLNTIQYTGTYNSLPNATVEFNYETRSDVFTGYVAGSKNSSLKRLNKIVTKVNAATIYEYSFLYESANTTFRSRLAKIRKCAGVGGVNGCVKDTNFTWTNGDSTFANAIDTGINNIGYDSNKKIVDVNGDGKSDLVLAYGGFWHIRLSTGSGFGNDINTGIASVYAEYSQAIDYDGDGRMDVIFPADKVWKIMRSTGSNFQLISTGVTNAGYQNNLQIADVNGDGLSDLVLAYNSKWYVRLNTGGGFGAAIDTGINNVSWQYAQAVDMNGDGKTDIALPREYVWKYLQWTGTTLALISTTTSNTGYTNNPKFMDINGDSLPDLVYPYNYVWNIRLNRGGEFGPQIATTLNTLYWDQAMQIDYNRDGRVDLIYPVNTVWNILLSTGDNFTLVPTTINNVGWDNKPSVADVNGDGLTDLLLAYNSHWIIRPHNGMVEDYLVGIDNGAGVTRSIQYIPITNSSIYTKGTTATYPSQDIQFDKYVVSEQTTTDGLNGTVRTTYKYGGARVDLRGRGDLGFAWTES